jgi:glycosyltransferase involved in cell wall biosynthesis
LASDSQIDVKVFYTWSQAKDAVFDPDFGINRSWDIPLLEGYNYTFVHNISSNPGSSRFNGIVNPTLIAEIEQWKADAVLVYGWNFTSHLKAMRYFKGKIPVIFRGDSTMLDEPTVFSIKKLLRRVLLSWVYRHIDYAFYVGAANKAYYEAHGVKQNQLVYAPHAIDNNRFSADDAERNLAALQWRQKLGIGTEDVVFVFAGKLSSKKNPEILIKAFNEVSKSVGGRKLVIAGNGSLENSLKEKYAKNQDIRFIGFQNQTVMPVLYRMADVYVLPSQGPGETWGLAANEAMACKRTVIISDKCGCAFDVVQQSQNGFVFHYNNASQLADYLSLGKKEYLQLGATAGETIKAFNYQAFLQALKSINGKTTPA